MKDSRAISMTDGSALGLDHGPAARILCGRSCFDHGCLISGLFSKSGVSFCGTFHKVPC